MFSSEQWVDFPPSSGLANLVLFGKKGKTFNLLNPSTIENLKYMANHGSIELNEPINQLNQLKQLTPCTN